MMRVDHLAFIATAMLLILALRAAPRRVGRWIHGAVSVAILAIALGSGASILATALFVYVPFLAVRHRRSLPTSAFAALVGAQLFSLGLLRHYFTSVPGLGRLLPFAHPPLEVIGLSYVVLRQIEWMLWIDADDEATVDLVDYTNFTLGFFTLLAGPIARYGPFTAGFLSRDADERPADVVRALNRVVNGYICVVLIAPFLGAFTSIDVVSSASARARDWALFVYLYPLQLFLNFSGYCDIVIGLAKLCRIDLPENFARPFLATNLQEFWQRWHMTFSSWMRDFVFYPSLRALRRGPLRGSARSATALSALLSFLLVGLWHGPRLGFVLFGLLHGAAVLLVHPYSALLERLLGSDGLERYQRSPTLRLVRVGACYSYVAITCVCFDRTGADLVGLWHHFARATAR
jgi:D-alanyl-lipoteichoic acid acyltransferase DltB (MBOAT superfamily)